MGKFFKTVMLTVQLSLGLTLHLVRYNKRMQMNCKLFKRNTSRATWVRHKGGSGSKMGKSIRDSVTTWARTTGLLMVSVKIQDGVMLGA